MHDEPQVQHTLPGIPELLTAPAGNRSDWPAARWLLEGLRAGVFLMPRVAGRTPTPLQVFILTALVLVLELALLYIEVIGPARLDVQAWLSAWWTAALFIGLAWWAFPWRRSPAVKHPNARSA